MVRIPVDLVGIAPQGSLEITDKLDECRFFLLLMKRTKDWARFRWLTSAYLNAARAALDWVDRAARVLADDRAIRADDPVAVRRACEVAVAAGFHEVAIAGARRALVAAGFPACGEAR